MRLPWPLSIQPSRRREHPGPRRSPSPYTVHRTPYTAPAVAAAPRPDRELGWHGSTIWDGLVREDYNPDLHHPRSIETYDKMRKSDGQVQGIETVIALPVRTVRYYVEPGGAGRADKEAAELIEQNLIKGDGMSHTFDDLIREALVSVIMGFQVFEQVYVEEGGLIRFRKFADRHPRTIKQWSFDDHGGIAGFVQEGYDKTGKFKSVPVPAEKTLRFSYRQEWGNPEGFPLARVMYKHWFIKDALYKITNIGAERDWVGTPVGQTPAGASEDDKRQFQEALENLSTHEQSAITLPPGYSLEAYAGHTRTDAIMAYIEHQDKLMAVAALAGFIMLPGQAQGSRALSEDQSQFFLLCEEALATWICSIINQFAITRLCEWNWPGIPAYPTLEHAHIGSVLKPVAVGHALAALVNKQLLTPDDDIENAVREMMNLPEIPPEQSGRDRRPAPPAPPGRDVPPGSDAPPAPRVGASLRDAQHPASRSDAATPLAVPPPLPQGEGGRGGEAAVASRLDLARVRSDLDGAEDALVKRGRELLEQSLDLFERRAGAIVDKALRAPPVERGKAHLELAELQVPRRNDYAAWLRDLLLDVVERGMVAARIELGQDDIGAVSNELRSFVRAQAIILAEKHFADLKFVALARLQRDLDARLGRDKVMWNVKQELRRGVTAALGRSLDDAIRATIDQVSAALAGL